MHRLSGGFDGGFLILGFISSQHHGHDHRGAGPSIPLNRRSKDIPQYCLDDCLGDIKSLKPSE